MKEDKAVVKNSAGKENEPVTENGKKKSKEERPATKVVVRRLPPTMTEEQFKMQVSPLPDIDYFYFVPADMSLMPNAFSRAYINFVDQADLFIFTQKFDGYVFIDSKGGEFPAVVEFAPFQRIPKNRPNRKKDPKVGSIETDPLYIAFKERLEAESLDNKTTANASKQHFFETSLVPEKKEVNNTPLLDYIRNRRAERQRIRDEKREEKRKKDMERRRAKDEQRRTKKEDDNSVVKVLNSQNISKERPKEKEVKQSFTKKKLDEIKPVVKEKSSSEGRLKESKARTGKSYLEERQRQAERREEQKKKLSQNQSSSSVTDTKCSLNSEDKNAVNEDKITEEVSAVNENKGKDADYKKAERAFKREETRRNSYKYDKYDSKRERESEDSRRTRRINNERSHQSSRKDDERSEDGGRKRYSESRRSHDSSQRDKYKDKDKNKTYGQKKISGSATEVDKNKITADSICKQTDNHEMVDENSEKIESEIKDKNEVPGSDQTIKANCPSPDKQSTEELKSTTEQGAKPKIFESKDKAKPARRKSLDYDKTRSSFPYSSSKSCSKEKYSEKRRRNSVGSSKHNQENVEITSQQDDKDLIVCKTKEFLVKKSSSKEKLTTENIPLFEFQTKNFEEEGTINKERDVRKEFENNNRGILKRRNSTGERQGPEKVSPRRNSLGSDDKNQICNFSKQKSDSEVISEEEKSKGENKMRSSRDPRTERRIRNKDRPTMEIYRPGMGKFSKQRLEREKGLGSSTEVESPSSSPSPTPVLRHKTVFL